MIDVKNEKKSLVNIFSYVDFAVMFVWLAVFVAARAAADAAFADYLAAAYVIVYLAAIVWVLFYTVFSIVSMIKKKRFSVLPTVIAYALNIAFSAILISVIMNIKTMGSALF